MRGSGKTHIARKIATTLKRRHIDIDKEIQRQERMSISHIVNKKGWPHFRKIEKYVTRRVSNLKDVVISAGGGTIIDNENTRKLKKHGIIVFLDAPVKILAARILAYEEETEKRPSLTAAKNLEEEMTNVWNKRQQQYRETANYTVDVSQDSDNLKQDLRDKSKKIIDVVSADYPEFCKPEELKS